MIAEPALNDLGGTNDEKVLSLLVLVSLIGMGCHHMYSEIQGSGKRELEKREVSPFTSITTQGAFDIEVICQIDLIEVRTRIHPCSRNTRLPCQPQERTRPRPQKKLDSTPTPYPGNHENRAAAQEFALWPERG